MAKRLAVSEITGTIYDAILSKNKEFVTMSNKTDRTDECIRAVAEHMKCKADDNDEARGFYAYRWKGKGTLTWQSEKLR